MSQEFQSNQYENQGDFQKINTKKLSAELYSLEGSAIIELFEIDTKKYGGQIYRFHGGKAILGDIVFGGNPYVAYPLEVEGFEIRGDGSLPRPKLTLGNVDGFVSNIINGKDDFIGLPVKRIRVFLKYLDSANFIDNINPFGSPDETAKFPDEKYFINQKLSENKNTIQFEITSELELEQVKLPARTVYANFCPWIYRGKGCNYGNADIYPRETAWYYAGRASLGFPAADSNNNEFTDARGYNFAAITANGDWAVAAPWQKGRLLYQSPLAYSGFYDATGIYTSGDIATINSAESDDVVLYFVAKPTGIMATKVGDPTYDIDYYNVSGKDPRYDSVNWVQDQCSKNLSGCLIRFAVCSKGLPYGGFPGTERFSYG